MFRTKRNKPEEKPDERKTLREKVAKNMTQMIKSKEWLQLYSTLQTHVEALRVQYGKSPRLSKKMSMEQLQKLYTDIHADKWGHL